VIDSMTSSRFLATVPYSVELTSAGIHNTVEKWSARSPFWFKLTPQSERGQLHDRV
jgi:hypothetical protein